MRLSMPLVALLVFLVSLEGTFGIRVILDREECFSHKVEYGQTVHFSFVVIKSERSWHYSDDGVDLVVKGPNGEQVHDIRDKTSDKHEFVAHTQGVYRFCFTNKSPYHETLDFDVHAAHFSYHDEHAKDAYWKARGSFIQYSIRAALARGTDRSPGNSERENEQRSDPQSPVGIDCSDFGEWFASLHSAQVV